jgi:peptide/nickel transport system ATP-binding protein
MRGGRIEGIEPAAAFSGHGEALKSAYARALWMALPGRGFKRHVEAA